MTSAHETALVAALVAVAKSMGADQQTITRIREAVRNSGEAAKETWLSTKQVCERLSLSKKTVLEIKNDLGVVEHSIRNFRYPLSKVLEWERGQDKEELA
jgi:predicted transcriptional regulator